jgi:hypothetical protein
MFSSREHQISDRTHVQPPTDGNPDLGIPGQLKAPPATSAIPGDDALDR